MIEEDIMKLYIFDHACLVYIPCITRCAGKVLHNSIFLQIEHTICIKYNYLMSSIWLNDLSSLVKEIHTYLSNLSTC